MNCLFGDLEGGNFRARASVAAWSGRRSGGSPCEPRRPILPARAARPGPESHRFAGCCPPSRKFESNVTLAGHGRGPLPRDWPDSDSGSDQVTVPGPSGVL